MIGQPDIRPENTSWWAPRYRLHDDYVMPQAPFDDLCNEIESALGRSLTTEEEVRVSFVPRGFTTDGSSEWIASLVLCWVPSGVLWFFGVRADGNHRAAAVVHDYHYARCGDLVPRAIADRAFYRLAVMGGMSRWRAWVRWAVIRMLGWIPVWIRRWRT